MRQVFAYLATAVVMLGLDFAWLTLAAPRLYRPRIGELMADKPSLAPAVVFYLVYVAGVLTLVVLAAERDGGWKRLLFNAAVFGLCAYATYDLTNQATLRSWSLTVTLFDIAWGMIITTLAASAGYAALRVGAK